MQTESFTLKTTPASKLFLRFIAALNTGNLEKITSFVVDNYAEDVLMQHSLDEIVKYYQSLYESSGGMNIHKVYLSQDYYIIVIVKHKSDDSLFIDKLKITRQLPYKVLEHFHEPAPM